MKLSDRLLELSIDLPPVGGSFGAYVSVKRVENLLYVSGQLPFRDGKLVASGPVPSRASIDEAKLAARQCVINALAAVAAVEGSVDVIFTVVRVGVFVNSDSTFSEQPKIANGASEFLIELLGENGKHARAAVGVNALPLHATVEVEFIFQRYS